MVAGTPCLVRVPQPARYALHKLIISRERNLGDATKKGKDIRQARLLIKLLKEDRPGDLSLALEGLMKRGKAWGSKLEAACKEAGISI